MTPGTDLKARYRMVERIGKGAQGETWRGSDLETDRQIVAKFFNLSEAGGWKEFDRFESEARILRLLDHPRIPRYVDFFDYKDEGSTSYVLIQELVSGITLEERVRRGIRDSIHDIRRMAIDLLDIVRYIHSFSPPIVHRDINPRNIIVDDDGNIHLVDFGGVQNILTSNGMTVIGTPGFIPVEQFSGRASVRSDYYACAATLLFVMSHQNPSDLPVRNMRIDLDEARLKPPEDLRAVLETYLEPDEVYRSLEPEEAIALLEGRIGPSGLSIRRSPDRPGLRRPPAGSKIKVEESGDGSQRITIPAARFRGSGIFLIPFALFWNGFIGFWTVIAIAMGGPAATVLFSLPFWGAGLFILGKAISSVFRKTEIEFDRNGSVRIERKVGPFKSYLDLPVSELGPAKVESRATRSGHPVTACIFEAGVKHYAIGEHLSEREKHWLCDVINAKRKNQ